MIFFIDEDSAAFRAWTSELRLRGLQVECLWNANEAFDRLYKIEQTEVQLVIIDVMLAVEDVDDDRFSLERTYEYLETGLCLLDDLVEQNPAVFPDRAVLLTNTINEKILRAAVKKSTGHKVPLWKKANIYSPVDFGDLVANQIQVTQR
jgi:CheY-like chemotaxis protein